MCQNGQPKFSDINVCYKFIVSSSSADLFMLGSIELREFWPPLDPALCLKPCQIKNIQIGQRVSETESGSSRNCRLTHCSTPDEETILDASPRSPRRCGPLLGLSFCCKLTFCRHLLGSILQAFRCLGFRITVLNQSTSCRFRSLVCGNDVAPSSHAG